MQSCLKLSHEFTIIFMLFIVLLPFLCIISRSCYHSLACYAMHHIIIFDHYSIFNANYNNNRSDHRCNAAGAVFAKDVVKTHLSQNVLI